MFQNPEELSAYLHESTGWQNNRRRKQVARGGCIGGGVVGTAHTERGKEQAQTKTERGRRSERPPERGRKEKVKI